MPFKTDRGKTTVIPLLTLGEQSGKSVTYCKYLGIVLDTEGSDDKDTQKQLRYQYCEAIDVGASTFFGFQWIFARNSPNLPEKLFCDFCLQIFSQKDHEDCCLTRPPKKDLLFFSTNVRPFFEVKQRWTPFFPGFAGILPRYLRFCLYFHGFCQNF